MHLLPFLHSHSTILKVASYSIMVTLAAILGVCLAIHNGFQDEPIKCFLAGCAALCLFLLAAEEHRLEEMLLRGWKLRVGLGRRDSGWGGT